MYVSPVELLAGYPDACSLHGAFAITRRLICSKCRLSFSTRLRNGHELLLVPLACKRKIGICMSHYESLSLCGPAFGDLFALAQSMYIFGYSVSEVVWPKGFSASVFTLDRGRSFLWQLLGLKLFAYIWDVFRWLSLYSKLLKTFG